MAAGDRSHDLVGRRLAGGRYYIQKIGAGAYGDVYLARDDEAQQPVAIKTLRDEAADALERRADGKEGVHRNARIRRARAEPGPRHRPAR